MATKTNSTKTTKSSATKTATKQSATRSNPMTPKAGYTTTRRRYGEGGKTK